MQRDESNSTQFAAELASPDDEVYEAVWVRVVEDMDGVSLVVRGTGADDEDRLRLRFNDSVGAYVAGVLASSSGVVFG